MTEMKKYDCLIVDMVNFCHRTFKIKDDTLINVLQNSTAIYQNSVCKAITSLEKLCQNFLKEESSPVYLLFDNYFSKADMQSTFLYAGRKQLNEAYKANRKKELKEFYQTVNFLKYYYLIGPARFYTVQITDLEADDLVKPLLQAKCTDKSSLMITTDLDWARYLSESTDWLPDMAAAPQTVEDLSQKLGFPVTETNIILYKAIFGDKSDNIEALAKETSNNRKQLFEIFKQIQYPDDIFTLYRDPDLREQYPLLSEIMEVNKKKYGTEGKLSANIYLVSAIPCSTVTLEKHLIKGRNSGILYDSVRKVIGLSEHKVKFTFGGVTVKKES